MRAIKTVSATGSLVCCMFISPVNWPNSAVYNITIQPACYSDTTNTPLLAIPSIREMRDIWEIIENFWALWLPWWGKACPHCCQGWFGSQSSGWGHRWWWSRRLATPPSQGHLCHPQSGWPPPLWSPHPHWPGTGGTDRDRGTRLVNWHKDSWFLFSGLELEGQRNTIGHHIQGHLAICQLKYSYAILGLK